MTAFDDNTGTATAVSVTLTPQLRVTDSDADHVGTCVWGVSRKLATSVNQGVPIFTLMDVLK